MISRNMNSHSWTTSLSTVDSNPKFMVAIPEIRTERCLTQGCPYCDPGLFEKIYCRHFSRLFLFSLSPKKFQLDVQFSWKLSCIFERKTNISLLKVETCRTNCFTTSARVSGSFMASGDPGRASETKHFWATPNLLTPVPSDLNDLFETFDFPTLGDRIVS